MDFSNIVVKVNEPYPEIVGATENAKTVKVLKDLMSSSEGELTAILTYFYQSSVSRCMEPEIADILEEISIVEMQHMDILSNAIVSFGGLPTYTNSRNMQYTTNYINYNTNLKTILTNNIKAEEEAIRNYELGIDLVQNESLKLLFERIIKDEKKHIEIFKMLEKSVKFLMVSDF